jgi:hypothetical protein
MLRSATLSVREMYTLLRQPAHEGFSDKNHIGHPQTIY